MSDNDSISVRNSLYLHVFSLSVHFYALYGFSKIGFTDPNIVVDNIKVLKDFSFHFFTLWNFALQIIFLISAIGEEASKLLNYDDKTQVKWGKLRSFLFSTLVMPSTFMVTTIFWGIWQIDRELIFPKAMDTFFPLWLNHMLHTFIIVPVVIELLLPKRNNFISYGTAFRTLAIYLLVYQALFTSIYLRYGVWLYPIYKYMTWLERFGFTMLQFSTGVVYQVIGVYIQNSKKAKLHTKEI